MKYKYYLRPGYKSQNLLIEIFAGAEDEYFLTDLLDSISEINPKVDKMNNLWMNDEIDIEISSDIGLFNVSKDIWDLAFIMSDNNQECIKKINLILQNNKNFQKADVNFDSYK